VPFARKFLHALAFTLFLLLLLPNSFQLAFKLAFARDIATTALGQIPQGAHGHTGYLAPHQTPPDCPNQ